MRLRCDGDGVVFRSELPQALIPQDPTGMWACTTFTIGGQLVGVRKFEVLTKTGESVGDAPRTGSGSASGGSAGSGSAGSGSAGSGSAGSASSHAGSATGSGSPGTGAAGGSAGETAGSGAAGSGSPGTAVPK